jgi:dihydropyrimidine dehydrogenase (NAD+) subunit PreT
MAAPDIRSGRLPAAQVARNFDDIHPPLTPAQARIESERCYYCFDAPCVAACPTGIDIPSFIRRIAEDNLRGAARAILEENVFGGMCARVCPTEVLCEQACVRNAGEDKPVEIGSLQRHATDHLMAHPGAPLFTRAAPTGKRVAVVGAGPAGLACAHRLAWLGHEVEVFDAKSKPGGLNEYGLAAYKTPDDFAQREIAWLLSIGGITIRHAQKLGRDITLDGLRAQHDAVFLAIGLAGVNALGMAHETIAGLENAVDFIARLRQSADPSKLPMGRRVIVIGGGMTAIDAAVQSRRLGAEEVTIVYRRGQAQMPATAHEQAWAQHNGVLIRPWSVARELHAEEGHVTGITFATTREEDGRLVETGETWTAPADLVFKAIGQTLDESIAGGIALHRGRIQVDAHGRTSRERIWAGGDCTFGGKDLTVEGVEHGKIAAHDIDRELRGGAVTSVSAPKCAHLRRVG